jgi:hypothetical protein
LSQNGGRVVVIGKNTLYFGSAEWEKWRFMQPARRPVIANPQGEAIHTGTLDCCTLRVRNDGDDDATILIARINRFP